MAKIAKVLPRRIVFPAPGDEGSGVYIEIEIHVEDPAQKEDFTAIVQVPVLPVTEVMKLAKWTSDYLRDKGYAPGIPL